MDQFSELFEYLQAYGIIICKLCRHGVYSDQIVRHLRDQHKDFSVQQRNDILRYSRTLGGIARTAAEVIFPDSASNAIPYLPVYKDGYLCKHMGEDGN